MQLGLVRRVLRVACERLLELLTMTTFHSITNSTFEKSSDLQVHASTVTSAVVGSAQSFINDAHNQAVAS